MRNNESTARTRQAKKNINIQRRTGGRAHLGTSRSVSGRGRRGHLEASWARLRASRGSVGASWFQNIHVRARPAGDRRSTWLPWLSWCRLGAFLGRLGCILGRLGCVLGRLGAVLARLCRILRRLGRILDRPGGVLSGFGRWDTRGMRGFGGCAGATLRPILGRNSPPS